MFYYSSMLCHCPGEGGAFHSSMTIHQCLKRLVFMLADTNIDINTHIHSDTGSLAETQLCDSDYSLSMSTNEHNEATETRDHKFGITARCWILKTRL